MFHANFDRTQVHPHALQCYREINALEGKTGVRHGLGKGELVSIVHFIETELPARIASGSFYLKKEETKLSRTIEYDPESERTFIHLKRKGVMRLNGGCEKRPTLSIEYGEKPQYVINAVFERTPANECEIRAFEKMRNTPGVLDLIAAGAHTKRSSGSEVVSIITPWQREGTLRDCRDRGCLTVDDKVNIALDVMRGLASLHRHGIAHGDIHSGNCLINSGSGSLRTAVLADLGKAYDLGSDPLAEVKDLYAAGCMLYEMVHGMPRTPAHWDKLNCFPQLDIGGAVRGQLMLGPLGAVTERLGQLEKLNEMTAMEEVELIALRLMHPRWDDCLTAEDASTMVELAQSEHA